MIYFGCLLVYFKLQFHVTSVNANNIRKQSLTTQHSGGDSKCVQAVIKKNKH